MTRAHYRATLALVSTLAACAHRAPANTTPTAAVPAAVAATSVAEPGAPPAAEAAPAMPAAQAPEANAAQMAEAPAAPPDPHKWDFCAVREPRKTAKNVSYINPDTLFEASTYSFGAKVPATGSVVHFSGQIPVDTSYVVQGQTLTDQLKVAIKNLCLAMSAAGVTTADVYRLGVIYVHKDAADPFVLAEELHEFFDRDEMPATTMASAPYIVTNDIRVQIEASAYVPEHKAKR